MPNIRYDIIKPRKTMIWKWPAVVNMSFGAAAAAQFLFSAAGMIGAADPGSMRLFFWISPITMILGLCTVSLELGQPRHMVHSLSNLKSSWMSREVMAAILFVILCFFIVISATPSGWLLLVTASVAMAFIVSQGIIVRRCLAVTPWNHPQIVLFFISAAAASGFALYQLGCLCAGVQAPSAVFWLGIGCVALNAAVWMKFIHHPNIAAVSKLRSTATLTVALGFGHIIPLLLLVVSRLISLPVLSVSMVVAMCALAIITGTIMQKYALIRQAAIMDGVQLPCTPESLKTRPKAV